MHSEPPSLVLVLSANPESNERVRGCLEAAGHHVLLAECVEDALAACESASPDVVLLDLAVHASERLFDAQRGRPALALIVLSDGPGVERALARGASDGVTIPYPDALLVHRVASVTHLARAERELARLRTGSGEGLGAGSGISTRASFCARLEHAIEAHRPERGSIAVLDVAIDSRAAAGVLPTIVQRLKDGLRDRDTIAKLPEGDAVSVARITDDELTVLLGALERPQDAYKIARRLQEQLAAPIEVAGAHAIVPVSIGIAIGPEDGARATELVDSASRAMREARDEGKSLIRFARPAMNALIFERLALESHLRHALDRGELSVHYQPRVSIETGEIVSVEALVRWKHPELGLVSPGHFIPVAEESGLILPIGEWVLREATAQNRRWRDAGLPHVDMAVNLSPAQFREPDLVGVVRRALDDAGLAPDSLELELTESMLLQKGDATVKTLEALRAMGVHLAIDDFGTGYSSLSYIKRFPVDALKIDQSFIREVTSNAEDSALTTSIILMGKSLGLTVVAEGVETRSQLGMLQALGCDQAQGYLFSRPVPADEAAALLAVGIDSSLAA